MNKSQYTRECLLSAPLLISKLLKDKSFNPKITKGILYNMIPFRSSIEIECITSLSRILNAKQRDYSIKIADKYDIFDYSDDKQRLQSKEVCEHRISIRNYSQASGLYKILQDMKKYCTLNPGSGIHLHIDANKIINNDYLLKGNNVDIVTNYLNPYLYTLEEIFGKYPGTFNYKRIGLEDKHAWINIRYQYLHSIEFRIAPMTFDYETIILWIIKCNQIVKQLHKKLRISY
jgi:hypothetical protein